MRQISNTLGTQARYEKGRILSAWLVLLFAIAGTRSAEAGFGIGSQSPQRWAHGVIPYRFSPDFNATVRRYAESAMAAWQRATGGSIRFVPHRGQPDHVVLLHPKEQGPCQNRSNAIGRGGGAAGVARRSGGLWKSSPHGFDSP